MNRLYLDTSDNIISMRSFYNPDKFFKKMKKKPAQQEVLDNIENYTSEQIENLSGPHFPQWIKDQLLELKKRNGTNAEDEAIRIAEMMIAASKR
jgi:hypothetical protein